MAEYVEQSIEEMLPELEQMERVGLFTNTETRQILKKRKALEYKLHRRTKQKEDYLKYIQYETNLHALVKKRRKRIGYTYKKVEIDVVILQRIHKLFRLATMRFPHDIKLWLTYIYFCKKRGEKSNVSRLYTKVLQVHNKKPDLWIAAAKWEFEVTQNPDNGRSLLQRALRFMEHSQVLWREYYRLELMFAEKMRNRKELLGDLGAPGDHDNVKDAVLEGQVAVIVYRQALEAIPDNVDFLISFLQICSQFDFTIEHEGIIFKDLREKFPNEPVTWDALARYFISRKNDGPSQGGAAHNEMMFHHMYEIAVSNLQSDEIWSLYIKACLELVEKTKHEDLKTERITRAVYVLEEAKDAQHLTAELWGKWVALLKNTGSLQEALAVARASTQRYGVDMRCWKDLLTLQIAMAEPLTAIQASLTAAQAHIPKKESWPLINMVLEYLMDISEKEELIKLLESSMISCCEVSQPAKEMHLQHEYFNHGIEQARLVYKRVSQDPPLTLAYYQMYIKMEMSQSKIKMKHIRRAYEDAVVEHGKHNADLWLDYIRAETSHGKPEGVGQLHFRAIKKLKGDANDTFREKYTLLQTGGQA